MDEARQPDVPPALRGGRLEGITFPDLLWALCRRRSTGVLRVAASGAERALYLDRGRIVFASSSDPNDRLGELFLREGRITLDQLEVVLSRLTTGKRLGTLLVESGALSADQLVQGVLSQVERIVLSLFGVEEGDYRFEDGPLPTDEVITLGSRTGELILRGIRQIRSFGRIRRSVGGPLKTYGLADGWRGVAEGMRLTDGEQQLLDRLRAGDAAIETLCRDLYLSNFEIYQTLLGFRVLGLAEEREPRREPITDASSQGVLADDGFAELLVQLGRAGDTGVLYVTRGAQERTFHVSSGRCVFATSNDSDDGLVAYLLRRGVISLADREETAKRLLSNKRVGTILRELGVIDERDLREMVRRQLSEIVFDTFRWTNADYAFVRGALPSIEEITLEETLESLVAGGLRRVDSWSRVWRGCNGPDAALELRPSYLSVLDAMQAGADEWQIVTALKTPRTVREICRSSDLGDFRVCQILWTLRLLGAVGPASAEALDEARASASATADVASGTDIVESAGAGEATFELDRSQPPVDDEPTVEPAFEATFELDHSRPPVDDEPTVEPAFEATFELDRESAPVAEDAAVAEMDQPARGTMPVDDEPTGEPAFEATFELDRESAPVAENTVVEDVSEPEPERSTIPIEAETASNAGEDSRRIEIEAETETTDPGLDTTQLIPREALESALRGPATEADEDGVRDGASSVEAEVLDAAQALAEAPSAPAETRPEDTGPVSADELRRSLAEADAAAHGSDADQAEWVEPDDFDGLLSRFNAAHRLIYRAVRSEVGAGATNFLRATCVQRAPAAARLVDGVTLSPDGSWDAEGLRERAVAVRASDPWSDYLALLEAEIDRIGEFLGPARAADLRRQLDALAAEPATPA